VNAKKKNWNDTGIILEQYWNNTLTDTGTILSLKKKRLRFKRNTKCNENILEKRESNSIFEPERKSFFYGKREKLICLYNLGCFKSSHKKEASLSSTNLFSSLLFIFLD